MVKILLTFKNILSWIDLGSQTVPIKWSTRSISHPSKKTYNVFHGSAIGGFMTIVFISIIGIIFLNRFKDTMKGEFDTIISYSRTIDIENPHDAKMVNKTTENMKFKFNFAL